jgi:hypothetical protein
MRVIHVVSLSGESGCGGSDITSLAVFAAPAQDEKSSKRADADADADADAAAACQLLLVYASSTFADERVSCRAKLLQLHGNGGYDSSSSSSSWRITTEADLLHPPSKDTPHFDVTCIAGCRVRRRAVTDCKFVIMPGRGMCLPATSAATSLHGHCSLISPRSVRHPQHYHYRKHHYHHHHHVQCDVQWRCWAHPGGVSSLAIFSIRKTPFILSGSPCDPKLILWSLDGHHPSHHLHLNSSSQIKTLSHILFVCHLQVS